MAYNAADETTPCLAEFEEDFRETNMAEFNAVTGGRLEEIRDEEEAKRVIKENQKRFLITISMGVPFLKFLVACIVVSSMVYYDTVGNDLRKPMNSDKLVRTEGIYLPLLCYIPMSAVSLLLGYLTFSKFPNVTHSSVNQFVLYNMIVVVIQVSAIVTVVFRLKLTSEEHLIAHGLTVLEIYCLILIKYCSNRRFSGFHDPKAVEMEILPSIECRPNRRLSATSRDGLVDYDDDEDHDSGT